MSSPSPIPFAVAALLAIGECVPATAQVADPVSLTESTMTWSTVAYATGADNSFVDGSLDTKRIKAATMILQDARRR
jgi:hypothetical protein